MDWLLKTLAVASVAKKLCCSIKDQSEAKQTKNERALIHAFPYRQHPTEEQHRAAEQQNWLIQNRIAQRQIRWTRIAAIAAAIAGGFAYKSYVISVQSLKEARIQSDTAKSSLIATTRPWIKITGFKATRFQISSIGASVSIDLTFKNVGNAPVQAFAIAPELLIPELQPNSINEVHRICEKSRRNQRAIIENSLFPGDEPTSIVVFGRTAEDVMRGDASFSSKFPQIAGYATFEIAGCVTYRFDSSPDVHETSFVYTLERDMKHPGAGHGGGGNFFNIRSAGIFVGNELETSQDLLGQFAD